MRVISNSCGLLKYASAAAVLSVLIPASAQTARGADMVMMPAMPRMTTNSPGPCSHQHVLSRANDHFAYQVRHVPGLPHLKIRSFSNITQTRYEPATGRYNITRHYCTASVRMDNGEDYPAAYVIAEKTGFAGAGGFDVDFCVDGFDRWRVHDNACRSLR